MIVMVCVTLPPATRRDINMSERALISHTYTVVVVHSINCSRARETMV